MKINRLYETVFSDKNKKIGPETVMISPTDYCNLNCKICWRRAKNGKYGELSIDKINDILKECKKLGTNTIDLTGGGEPFFREDILKILKLVKNYEFKGTLTTNATLLTTEKIKKIVKMGWDDLSFSLDGPNPEINDYIRGEGIFKKVIKAIERFKKIKKELRFNLPFLRISTVITRSNYKDLDKLIELAKDLGIEAINFSTLIEFKTNKEFSLESVDEADLKFSIKKALRKSKDLDIHTNLEAIHKFGVLEHDKPNFCFAPWIMSFINANGKVMVCCTLASLYYNIIGDVKKTSFKEIWFGESMNKFRERIKRKDFPEKCKKCLPEFTERFNEYYEKIKKE